MVVEHKHKIGFKGDIWVEPKPLEPTKNQYRRDVGIVFGFLKQYGLETEVRVNIKPNHATLAGNSFEHEVEMANAYGIFGSIDFNRGGPQNGWDTDQFPNDLRETTLASYYILKGGGFKTADQILIPKCGGNPAMQKICSTDRSAEWICWPAPSSMLLR